MGAIPVPGFPTPKKVLRPVRPRAPWSGQLFTVTDTVTITPDPVVPPVRCVTQVSQLGTRLDTARGRVSLQPLPRNPNASKNPIRPAAVLVGQGPPQRGQASTSRLLRADPVVIPPAGPGRPRVVRGKEHPCHGVVHLSRVPGPTPVVVPTPAPLPVRVVQAWARRWEPTTPTLTAPPSPGVPIPARPPTNLVGRSVTSYRRLLQGFVESWRPLRDIYIEPPPGGGRVPKKTLLGTDI